MKLADFTAISNGKYNIGSIRLQGEGDNQSLVKVNNHRWLANKVADNPFENTRVRHAFSEAILNEAGIPDDVAQRLVQQLNSAENIGRPLERREVKSILQQIGESRLKDNGITIKFNRNPSHNAVAAMTSLACAPARCQNTDLLKLIVSSAITAYNKGNVKLNRDFAAEARVQVFRTMFKNLEIQNRPTDRELRRMTPEDFFEKCADIYYDMTGKLGTHTAGNIFPGNSLFAKYRVDKDWDSGNMQEEQMKMCGQMGVFTPGDLATLKSGVKVLNINNLPGLKVVSESRVGEWLRDMAKETEEEAQRIAENKIDKDVTSGRIKGEFRFSVNDGEDFVSITNGDEGSNGNREVIKRQIDEKAANGHQASAVKLLLTQEPLQPFRQVTHMLGLYEYDEHSGFNYYLSQGENDSLVLEIDKPFLDYEGRNISATFIWRIETDGTATVEHFNIQLPQ